MGSVVSMRAVVYSWTTERTEGSTAGRKDLKVDNGLSCMMSVFASDNQIAVSSRCAALQTHSSKGADGREIRVVSVGKAVMDLNSSLIA